MKLIEKLQSDPRIDEILVEQGIAHHRVSYFVHLKRGFAFGGSGEAHCFGEDTLRDIQRSMRSVTPCDCKECSGSPRPPSIQRDRGGYI